MGRHAEELSQEVAPCPARGGHEFPRAAGRRHARCCGHRGQLSRVWDLADSSDRAEAPRPAAARRLRDEWALRAGVEERRRPAALWPF